MDLRTKKTRRAIREAFLLLRAKKPLERITVKELTELAEISKATFYLHFQDIYDLSDQLQQEVIEASLARISRPDDFLKNPLQFMQTMVESFAAQKHITQVLFSGTHASLFPSRIEAAYRSYYVQHFPALAENAGFQIFLSYEIYGAYYAFLQNEQSFGRDAVLESLRDLSSALTQSDCFRKAVCEAIGP